MVAVTTAQLATRKENEIKYQPKISDFTTYVPSSPVAISVFNFLICFSDSNLLHQQSHQVSVPRPVDKQELS